MPLSLVQSQFRALERPENEAQVTTVSSEQPLDEILGSFLAESGIKALPKQA